MIYVYDLSNGFSSYKGTRSLVQRYIFYLFVAVVATVLGACFIKYTPGILHKYATPLLSPPFRPLSDLSQT